jgi:hypothetical protein
LPRDWRRLGEPDLSPGRRRFLDAWPERDVSEEIIRSGLDLAVSSDDEGSLLTIRLLGRIVTVGFDGSERAAVEVVDDLAINLADDAEEDRWVGGDRWREYRS